MMTIHIDYETYHKKLCRVINDPNADAIAHTILCNIDDRTKSLLYNTLDGFVPKSKFYVGETVFVPVEHLIGWVYKLDQQKDLEQGKYKRCIVKEVNPYETYGIKVEVVMTKTDGADYIDSISVRENNVKKEDYG